MPEASARMLLIVAIVVPRYHLDVQSANRGAGGGGGGGGGVGGGGGGSVGSGGCLGEWGGGGGGWGGKGGGRVGVGWGGGLGCVVGWENSPASGGKFNEVRLPQIIAVVFVCRISSEV